MSRSRDIGTGWETTLVKFFVSLWPKIKRIGSRDYGAGDLEGVPNFCIEAKAESVWGKARLEKWMDQAEASRKRVKKKYKILFVRRKYHKTGRSYAIMELDDWYDLVAEYDIK